MTIEKFNAEGKTVLPPTFFAVKSLFASEFDSLLGYYVCVSASNGVCRLSFHVFDFHDFDTNPPLAMIFTDSPCFSLGSEDRNTEYFYFFLPKSTFIILSGELSESDQDFIYAPIYSGVHELILQHKPGADYGKLVIETSYLD